VVLLIPPGGAGSTAGPPVLVVRRAGLISFLRLRVAMSTVSPPIDTEFARRIRTLSAARWSDAEAVTLIGQDETFRRIQDQVVRFAPSEVPVLITGETGTGKELLARALYLFGPRQAAPFISVNCARFQNNQTITSELFGHRRGSFTGADRDHHGLFEAAAGGVLFLDEVSELPPDAQAMLLRVISEGEILPLGSTKPLRAGARLIAATNRNLAQLMEAGEFRSDLYFRLSMLRINVPPLRERGDDWRLLLDFYTRRLDDRRNAKHRFSAAARRLLAGYGWPGNVRELKAVVEVGHCLSDPDGTIQADALLDHLVPMQMARPAWRGADGNEQMRPQWDCRPRAEQQIWRGRPEGPPAAILRLIAEGNGTFWDLVHQPFIDRDLNRYQVRTIVEEGLRCSHWSYKRALPVLGITPDGYLKFMDFLRHHRLKPE
jgi:transcriptional regulator with GAF, ATPase, and Fis domain